MTDYILSNQELVNRIPVNVFRYTTEARHTLSLPAYASFKWSERDKLGKDN